MIPTESRKPRVPALGFFIYSFDFHGHDFYFIILF